MTVCEHELRSMQDHLARQARHDQLFGVYRGTVTAIGTQTADGNPELGLLGQLRVYVAEIWKRNSTDLPWADPVLPFAGNGYGALMLPRVGDGVFLLFEGGVEDHPVWLGGYWSHKAERPQPAAEDVRVIVSPGGHKIIIDDSSHQLQLKHASGNQVTIAKDSITIKVENGGRIVVNASGVTINDTALSVGKSK